MGELIRSGETPTHCRICEPQCQLIATVEEGRLTKVRGNRDSAYSKGHLCIKASAMIDVLYDPDRVLQPLKRTGAPGEFEPVSWDEALGDIATRLGAIRTAHGADSFATFVGNPSAYAYATTFFLGAFQEVLKVRWRYGVNSEDTASRVAANAYLYGHGGLIAKPDLWRAKFGLVIGANPKVSHGSLMAEPKVMEALRKIRDEGGRVVVADPRRSETAREFEHVAVRAGTDAWFLIGLIGVLLDEGLTDTGFIARHTAGFEALAQALKPFSLEECARQCGVEAPVIVSIARGLAHSGAGFVYGRTGTCTQAFGTLNNMLQDIVMALTGNLERAGGGTFGWSPIDFITFAEVAGYNSFNENPTRVRGHPDIFGMHPSTPLPDDILVPGAGQVRALMLVAGNPMLSTAAAGPRLEEALEALDLFVSLDLYVTESNRHADYILPVASFYEREDFPLVSVTEMLRPALWFSGPVVARRGAVREEWEILNELCARMGLGGAYSVRALRMLARLGLRITPRRMMDALLRLSAVGDRYGLRPGGLSLKKLEAMRDGVMLKDELPLNDLDTVLRTPDKRVQLCPPALASELTRLRGVGPDGEFDFLMIGLRELKSINSWLHNSARSVRDGESNFAVLHPRDAEALQILDGAGVTVRSRSGTITLPARISDEIAPGHVAVPHGWGHRGGGWRHANTAGGANSNLVASDAPDDIEPVSGMSVLNGIPVSVRPAA